MFKVNKETSERHHWHCSGVIIVELEQTLKSDSHLPKIYFICLNESPLKLMKKAFQIMFKSSVSSQDI